MPTFFERMTAETESERQGLSQIPQITEALRGPYLKKPTWPFSNRLITMSSIRCR